MKTTSKVIGVGLLFLAIGLTFLACSSTKDVYIDAVDVEDEFTLEKSGAQLWGETCSRCHLAPSPSSYNDTDWNTIGLHMRIRANLTESDSYKITDFLMSAN